MKDGKISVSRLYKKGFEAYTTNREFHREVRPGVRIAVSFYNDKPSVEVQQDDRDDGRYDCIDLPGCVTIWDIDDLIRMLS